MGIGKDVVSNLDAPMAYAVNSFFTYFFVHGHFPLMIRG